MDIQKRLLRDGKKVGMCEEFRKELKDGEKSVAQLCNMYHRGLDFCIEKNFPTPEFITKNFDQEELHKGGIYCEGLAKSEGQSHVVAMSEARVTVVVPDNDICDLTVRHNATVFVSVGYNAECYISAHDNATVFVSRKGEKARLCASVFGDNCCIFNQNIYDKINKK